MIPCPLRRLPSADGMVYEEQLKQINICALGPLRVSEALVKAGKVKGSIVIITSQAGSAEWRTTQNADEVSTRRGSNPRNRPRALGALLLAARSLRSPLLACRMPLPLSDEPTA